MKGKGFLDGSTAIMHVCLSTRTSPVATVNALVVNNNLRRHPATQPTARSHSSWRRAPPPLFGILEDTMMMMMEDGERSIGSAEATPTNDDQRQQQHEDLYHSLIFSSQLERDIRQQLKACGTDDFIQYLHDSAVNGDEEERQGLEELISMITTAKLEKEQTPQTPVADTKVEATTDASLEENDTNTNSEPPPPVLSNADLIKRANQIDKAVAAAALSDDEKPSDFISDCREVVNLSGGFNNNGQMRVGGR